MQRSCVSGVLFVALQLMGCGSDETDSQQPGSSCPDGAERRDAAVTKIDRSRLTNLGTTPLDYSDPNLWLCRPGNDPNECHANLDATEILKDNTRKTVERRPTKNPAFDCFYVYPTVSIGGTGNVQDFTDISATLDPLLNQAAPFAGLCEIYAPLYRQVSIGLGTGGGITSAGDVNLAFSDVEAAFRYYIDHLNQGRKFVVMGHSQGTLTLTRLVSQLIDPDPTLRAQMISALLIGGAVIVPDGQRVGGSFQNVPACSSAGETGCVIAYATFPAEAPPPPTSIFGRASAGNEAICSPLGVLAQNPGRFRGSYQPLAFVNPIFRPMGTLPEGITTPFVVYRDFFRGECAVTDGAHYLAVSIDKTADDQRPDPPYRSSGQEAIGFGLHVADYNLALDDLVEIVTLQTKAAGVGGCPPD